MTHAVHLHCLPEVLPCGHLLAPRLLLGRLQQQQSVARSATAGMQTNLPTNQPGQLQPACKQPYLTKHQTRAPILSTRKPHHPGTHPAGQLQQAPNYSTNHASYSHSYRHRRHPSWPPTATSKPTDQPPGHYDTATAIHPTSQRERGPATAYRQPSTHRFGHCSLAHCYSQMSAELVRGHECMPPPCSTLEAPPAAAD